MLVAVPGGVVVVVDGDKGFGCCRPQWRERERERERGLAGSRNEGKGWFFL
jgi:hypothetical protein